ncbi:hypothetical protein Trydic_g6367 [Trypoxylus dichotomus]
MLTDVEKRILSCIECPICTEYMSNPIYQCNAGHSVCSNCKNKVSVCPTCRVDIGSTRNYALESVAVFFKYPCPFSKNGCQVGLSLQEVDQHKIVCVYGNHQCPFCRIVWEGSHLQLRKHLLGKHWIFELDLNMTKGIELFQHPGPLKTVKFFIIDFNSIFYVHRASDAKNTVVKYAVQHIGNKQEVDKYIYQINFHSDIDNISNIQWSERCIDSNVSFKEIVESGTYIAISETALNRFHAFSVTIRQLDN